MRIQPEVLIELQDFRVSFGSTSVLHGIDLRVRRGESVGLVGESGCGKSVTWLAALGLLPASARVSGKALLHGDDILQASSRELGAIRGGRIALISQDPSSALNPVTRVGRQILEALKLHRNLSGSSATAEMLRLLDMVGLPDPTRRAEAYPHELSGGQNQRVMIAMALAGEPDLLIADEPTTALDATIQAQILDLIDSIRRDTGMALVLISHDLGIIADTCDRVCVMYAGRIVEEGISDVVFAEPAHPYTRGLVKALPRLQGPRLRLESIPGQVPDPQRMPRGCAFAPRCTFAGPVCRSEVPPLLATSDKRGVACHYPASNLMSMTG